MKTTLRRLPSGHAMDIAAIRTIGIDGNGCAHAVGEGLAAYCTDQADIDAVRTFIASMPPLTPEVPLAPPAVDAGSDIERVRGALAVARANLGYEKQRADAAEAKLASCESLLRAERATVSRQAEEIAKLRASALVVPEEVLKAHSLPWATRGCCVESVSTRERVLDVDTRCGSVADDRALAAAIVAAANGGAR